jgi:hypothetical protein
MSSIRVRAAVLLAVIITAAAAVITSMPAGAIPFSEQCSPSRTCMNFWNRGLAVRTYQGLTANNNIAIHWLGNGIFQLDDRLHPGSCVGDLYGSKTNPAMGGGNPCPSSAGSSAGWGTTFQLVNGSPLCPAGYDFIWSRHWLAYIGFASGNNHPVSGNTTGTCILPQV